MPVLAPSRSHLATFRVLQWLRSRGTILVLAAGTGLAISRLGTMTGYPRLAQIVGTLAAGVMAHGLTEWWHKGEEAREAWLRAVVLITCFYLFGWAWRGFH